MPEHNIRLPAEWEPQSGLLLTWPHNKTDWKDILDDVESVYIEIVKNVSKYQPVLIVCHDKLHKTHVNVLLKKYAISTTRYQLYIAPSNDTWMRDYGPITVLQDDQPLLLDYIFNGWGEKFPAELDNSITITLYKAFAFGKTNLKTVDFVLEGGSIETDGQGTFLVMKSCLLSPNRNKNLSQKQIEFKLTENLGAKRIIWLNHGVLCGDDTDGHIDTLARFLDTETIIYTSCSDKGNPNYQSLQLMKGELKTLKRLNGQPYNLVNLPLAAVTDDKDRYLPASYSNFLMINNALLVPQYGSSTDNEALKIFNKYCANRKITGIDCIPLIQQRGSLHCVSMQLPAGVITK